MSAILEQTSAGGGYRYQLTFHEAIEAPPNIYSVSNPYGGVLFLYASGALWTALAIDGVTVFDSAFSTTDTIMYTYLKGRYGTGNNYSFEFPYGQSIAITGTANLKIVSYKYQRIAETS